MGSGGVSLAGCAWSHLCGCIWLEHQLGCRSMATVSLGRGSSVLQMTSYLQYARPASLCGGLKAKLSESENGTSRPLKAQTQQSRIIHLATFSGKANLKASPDSWGGEINYILVAGAAKSHRKGCADQAGRNLWTYFAISLYWVL